jgi:hypothetical protein
MQGVGEHDYDVYYHFSSDARLFVFGEEAKGDAECHVRARTAELQMNFFASTPIQTDVSCGQVDPIQGWSSGRYGSKTPAPVLRVGMRAAAPVAMMSFLNPGKLMTSRRVRTGGAAIAAAVHDGNSEDIAVLTFDDAMLRVRNFTVRGEFFWLRTSQGLLTEVLAVNALSMDVGGSTIFRYTDRISHVRVHFWDGGMVIEQDGMEGKVYVRDLRDRQFQRR